MYKIRPRKIKFHEDGIPYHWDIPSREVTDNAGKIVAMDCYNLKQARKAVKRSR